MATVGSFGPYKRSRNADARRPETRGPIRGLTLVALGTGILLISLAAGVWTGNLKGDDAFFHVGNAQFVRDHFPMVWWFPYSHAGELQLLSYPLAPYIVLGALGRLGLSVEALLRLLLGGSLVAIGFALYALARRLDLGRMAALLVALLPFTSHAFWSWGPVGGAYFRVAAIPWFFVAIVGACAYVETRMDGRPARWALPLLILGLSVTALIHPLVFQFAAVFVVLFIGFGLRRWSDRGATLLLIFLPVAAFVAWQYLPLVASMLGESQLVPGAPRHDLNLMEPEWLFGLPNTREYTLGPGPVLFTVFLGGLAYVGLHWSRFLELKKRHRPLFALMASSFALSVYFILFGWLPLPSRLYLMAAFDYAAWSSLALSLFGVAVASFVVRERRGIQMRVFIPACAALLAGLIGVVPWVRTFSLFSGDPRDARTYSHATAKAASLARSMSLPGYRLGATSRTATRWLYYRYPNLENVGGRASVSPNRYYYERLVHDVFYRLDSDRLSTVYFEDRPKVVAPAPGGPSNFNPPMFWLDWYGSDNVVLDLPFYPQQETALGYASRPYAFDYQTVDTQFGPAAAASTRWSTPIVTLTEAPVVALPFLDGTAPSFYTKFLSILSALAVDSKMIIPIKLDSAVPNDFGRALVDGATYARHRTSLDRYVREGGRLVVLTNHQDAKRQRVRFGNGLAMVASAGSVSEATSASAFAAGVDGPVGICSERAAGTLCELGSSLDDLAVAGDVQAALLLLRALEVDVPVVLHETSSSPYLSYVQPGTAAALVRGQVGAQKTEVFPRLWEVSFVETEDTGEIRESEKGLGLQVRFGGGGNDLDQVNFSAPLSGDIPMNSASALVLELRTEQRMKVDFYLGQGSAFSVHSTQPKTGAWQTFQLPVGSFEPTVGSVRLANLLTVAVQPAEGTSLRKGAISLRDVAVLRTDTKARDPLLQVGVAGEEPRYQADLAWQMDERVPLTRQGALTFRMKNQGSELRNFAMLLVDPQRQRFLEHVFPPMRWSGERAFSVPLAAFSQQGSSAQRAFSEVEFVLNFDDAPSAQGAREFAIDDLRAISVSEPARPEEPSGRWEDPTTFSVAVPSGSSGGALLWKENYLPDWVVETQQSGVKHYFAGPGMIYVPLEPATGLVTFHLPLPTSGVVGFVITVGLSLLLAIAWVANRRGDSHRPGRSER